MGDMFKRLVDAVPEVKFELYSFKSTIKCKEMLEQDCWFENKESFHFSQLEKLLDIDSEFVALLKLEDSVPAMAIALTPHPHRARAEAQTQQGRLDILQHP